MELQGLELHEIPPFFNTLDREKDLVKMNPEKVMACDFVAGVKSRGELAGLTGIRIQYGFIPNLFIVINKKNQGGGLGNKLLEKNISYAKQHYNFLTLTTWDKEEYAPALNLYRKYRFNLFYRNGQRLRMYIVFNKKGEIICKVLPLIYAVLSAFWDLRDMIQTSVSKLGRFYH